MDGSDKRGADQLPTGWTWERFTPVDGTISAVSTLAPGKVMALHNKVHNRFVRMYGDGQDASDVKPANELPSGWSWERFTVVDAGNGQIALHNKAHNRFLRMHEDKMDGSDKRGADQLPTGWTWERFTPVNG